MQQIKCLSFTKLLTKMLTAKRKHSVFNGFKAVMYGFDSHMLPPNAKIPEPLRRRDFLYLSMVCGIFSVSFFAVGFHENVLS